MASESIEVHSHSFDTSSSIYTFLQSVLPYGLPIYRLFQDRARSDNALLIATFPPETRPKPGEPFVICFFDPTAPPVADGYLFTSLELGTIGQRNHVDESKGLESGKAVVVRQIIAVLQHSWAVWKKRTGERASEDGGESAQRSLIKLGATHALTAAAMRHIRSPEPERELIVRNDDLGPGGPYGKYIFLSTGAVKQEVPQLPSELAFDSVQPGDYDRVVGSNPFVSPSFLESMRNVGVRERRSGKLIAWAFFGPDGSIRTVHCEPEWRRKHLALAMALKLIQDDSAARNTEAKAHSRGDVDQWLQVDVAADNVASIKLFEKLGAKWAWDVYWLHVDLARLPKDL